MLQKLGILHIEVLAFTALKISTIMKEKEDILYKNNKCVALWSKPFEALSKASHVY